MEKVGCFCEEKRSEVEKENPGPSLESFVCIPLSPPRVVCLYGIEIREVFKAGRI